MRWIYDRVYPDHKEPVWIIGAIATVSLVAGLLQLPAFYLVGDIFPFEERTIFGREVALGVFYFRVGLFTGWSLCYIGFLILIEGRERDRRLAWIESERQTAEIRMLRALMNPHFLFNALNAIRSGVESFSPRLGKMVQSLSNYLCFSLDHGSDDFVPLGEEYDAMLDYLAVEKGRFQENLICECHIEDAARSVSVPGITLQPLVENAVKYAQFTADFPIRLRVTVTRPDPAMVQMIVSNAGEWMEEGAGPSQKASHIGLTNIRRRLALLYPNNHRVEVDHGNGWVTITVQIPASTNDHGNDFQASADS